MPEMPEIEVIKNSLQNKLQKKQIIDIEINRLSIRYPLDIDSIMQNKFAEIIECRRIAKYLIIDLSNNFSFVFHLGMSGRLQIKNNAPKLKHDHFILALNNDEKIIFNDYRRFGMIYSFPTKTIMQQDIFSKLGQEPLQKNFDINLLISQLAKRNIPIKNALMDNKLITGIGNIYASEILFQSAINPFRAANSLSKEEIKSLVKAIEFVLELAIKNNGTTLRDFADSKGKIGEFQNLLKVYARDGKACLICSNPILKAKQSGRTSFYCITCQN